MRISDLKKKSQPRPPADDRPPVKRAAPAPAPTPVERAAPTPPAPKAELPKLEPASAKPAPAAAPDGGSAANARRAYDHAVELMEKLFAGEAPSFSELSTVKQGLLAAASSSGDALLALTLSRAAGGDALARHSVNVAVIALKLGMVVRRSDTQLSIIGGAALLHDLGQVPAYRLSLEPGLKPDEVRRYRQRVADGAAHIADIAGSLPEGDAIAKTVAQLHVKNTADLPAQIVSLADAFDALTHGYDGKPAVHPCAAFKTLTSLAGAWDRSLVKRLLEELSPFPPGSLIELADGRIASVVAVNPKMLTRPVVEICAAPDGRADEIGSIVDLARDVMVGMVGVPNPKKLADSGLMGRLPGPYA